MLVVKVTTSLSFGVKSFVAEILLWGRDFESSFITIELIIGLLLAVLAWFIGSYFGELLDNMGPEQALISRTIEVPIEQGELSARDKLINLIYSILIILVIFTALARVDLRTAFSPEYHKVTLIKLTPLEGGGASTLAFFMLSLVLLSLTQFISLHANWTLANIPVNSRLAGRWVRYSIVFLLALTVITGLLPTHYSAGFLSFLGDILDVVVQAISFLMLVVFSIFSMLISLPFMLFGQKQPDMSSDTPAPQETPVMPQLEEAARASPLLDSARAIFFWVVFLAVVIFFVSQYLRQHEEVLIWLRRIPGWRFISGIWIWLKSLLARTGKVISRVVEGGRTRIKVISDNRRFAVQGGYINPRRLGPRQKIFFYYQTLIRRGGEKGIPRKTSQTPSEYAQALENALPDAEVDIDQLTGAFVEARYSRHDVLSEDANRVKNTWERIRRILRGVKNPGQG